LLFGARVRLPKHGSARLPQRSTGCHTVALQRARSRTATCWHILPFCHVHTCPCTHVRSLLLGGDTPQTLCSQRLVCAHTWESLLRALSPPSCIAACAPQAQLRVRFHHNAYTDKLREHFAPATHRQRNALTCRAALFEQVLQRCFARSYPTLRTGCRTADTVPA
jgi:hypothetical protein